MSKMYQRSNPSRPLLPPWLDRLNLPKSSTPAPAPVWLHQARRVRKDAGIEYAPLWFDQVRAWCNKKYALMAE